jgi:hypothetical protein
LRSLSITYRSAALALLIFTGLVSKSFGAPLVYFGLDDPRGTLVNSTAAFNSFTATLSSYGTDTLETYAGFTEDPTLTFGSTGITAGTDFDIVASFAVLAVAGNNALLDKGPAAAGGPAINDTFLFNLPITAFGTFVSNGGDASTANSISLLVENTVLGTSKTVEIGTLGPGASFNNVVFFGFTDTEAFNKITLIESFDYDGLLLDNITAGQVTAVPEASSVLLLTSAAAIAYVARRRRRR